MNRDIVISGRTITGDDIEVAVYLATAYSHLSRTELARTLCCCQEWVTGRDMPMLDLGIKVLERLESTGMIVLPPKNEKMAEAGRRMMKAIPITDRTNPGQDMSGHLSEFGEAALQIVQTADEKALWKEYVDRYHPEKYSKTYGTNLRYWIRLGAHTVGCMLFSASSWAIEDRDKWIGWAENDRKQRLIYVVNQSRFLLFPWIKVHCLASHVLSLAARRIRRDWMEHYFYAPVLLETFIDPSLYHGTCYAAANWKNVGTTKGRGRQDRNNKHLSTPRDIYVYPLLKDFRRYLYGKKDSMMPV